jgi:aryl-alcohol dehydrogenase-like predicted oxidoreductase
MRYARLGQTDLDVSVLGLGCGNFGGIGSDPRLFGRGDDEAAAFALMDAAREQGITLFDTANSYGGGRSEETIGRWFDARPGARDEVVLTTKVRNRVGPGEGDEGLSARHIRAQIQASLRRLRTDHVELYLAHEPDPATPIDETLAAFDELIRTGLVRHAGLSNYPGALLADAIEVAGGIGLAPPANLQCGYSLLERGVAADAFDVCERYGVAFTAFSPLAGGWLTGKYRRGEAYPHGSRMTLRPEPYAQIATDETYALLDALRSRAEARGVSLATLSLGWVVTDPAVTAAIVGPRTPEQLVRMCAALDVALTPAERRELAGAAPAGRTPLVDKA